MKILCGYSDLMIKHVPGLVTNDPREILVGHEITVVHSYGDVWSHMANASGSSPAFNIILVDGFLPWNLNSAEIKPSVLLLRHTDIKPISGIGLFLPPYFESQFDFYDEERRYALVANEQCWTFQRARDWAKLLELVLAQIPH